MGNNTSSMANVSASGASKCLGIDDNGKEKRPFAFMTFSDASGKLIAGYYGRAERRHTVLAQRLYYEPVPSANQLREERVTPPDSSCTKDGKSAESTSKRPVSDFAGGYEQVAISRAADLTLVPMEWKQMEARHAETLLAKIKEGRDLAHFVDVYNDHLGGRREPRFTITGEVTRIFSVPPPLHRRRAMLSLDAKDGQNKNDIIEINPDHKKATGTAGAPRHENGDDSETETDDDDSVEADGSRQAIARVRHRQRERTPSPPKPGNTRSRSKSPIALECHTRTKRLKHPSAGR